MAADKARPPVLNNEVKDGLAETEIAVTREITPRYVNSSLNLTNC